MKLRVNKKDIVNAYNICKDAIPAKSTIPVLETVYLEAQGEFLIMRGTNLEVYAEVFIPAQVEESGAVCVSRTTLEVLSKFDEGDIALNIKQDKLTISQNRRKHSPTYIDSLEFPPKPKVDGYQAVDTNLLKYVFGKTSLALGKDDTRKWTQCFHINPELGFVGATDGYRLSKVERIELPGTKAIPFGINLMRVLSKVKDEVQVTFGNQSGFKGNYENLEWEMIINSIADYAEDTFNIVDKWKHEKPVIEWAISSELKNILDMAKTYTDRADYGGATVLEFKEGIITLSLTVPSVVEMNETIEGNYIGEDFKIGFNATYLLDGLPKEGIIKFFGKDDPILIEDGNSYYLMAPMSFKEEE